MPATKLCFIHVSLLEVLWCKVNYWWSPMHIILIPHSSAVDPLWSIKDSKTLLVKIPHTHTHQLNCETQSSHCVAFDSLLLSFWVSLVPLRENTLHLFHFLFLASLCIRSTSSTQVATNCIMLFILRALGYSVMYLYHNILIHSWIVGHLRLALYLCYCTKVSGEHRCAQIPFK